MGVSLMDRAKNLVHYEVKSYVGVMGMFVRNPAHTVALALYLVCWHGVGKRHISAKPDPEVRTWMRIRETLAEQAYELRRHEGVPDVDNDLQRKREMDAIYEELEERERNRLYPFESRDTGKDAGGA